MPIHSQIANVSASVHIRRTWSDESHGISHNANMEDDDKNGGPNYLGAWMRYRKISGAKLAEMLGDGTTPGMVSDLKNSNRALSAKWLRRLAPILDTTPGTLLDHDPFELDSNVVDIWLHASERERKQIVGAAQAITKTGTSD